MKGRGTRKGGEEGYERKGYKKVGRDRGRRGRKYVN